MISIKETDQASIVRAARAEHVSRNIRDWVTQLLRWKNSFLLETRPQNIKILRSDLRFIDSFSILIRMREDWQLWAQTLHLPGLQDSAQCGGLCPGLQVTEDNLYISLLICSWCPGWPSGVRASASDQESPHLRILETVSCLTSSQRVFAMLVTWLK